MSYAYLIVTTDKGAITSSVNPSELFTEQAVQRVVNTIQKTGTKVHGTSVREIDGGDDTVVELFKDRLVF